MENWKKRTFILGGVIGLFAGLAASFIIVQQSEKKHTELALSATDGVKLGLGFLTFMRLVSEITNKD
jgi:hypothetical protein